MTKHSAFRNDCIGRRLTAAAVLAWMALGGGELPRPVEAVEAGTAGPLWPVPSDTPVRVDATGAAVAGDCILYRVAATADSPPEWKACAGYSDMTDAAVEARLGIAREEARRLAVNTPTPRLAPPNGFVVGLANRVTMARPQRAEVVAFLRTGYVEVAVTPREMVATLNPDSSGRVSTERPFSWTVRPRIRGTNDLVIVIIWDVSFRTSIYSNLSGWSPAGELWTSTATQVAVRELATVRR